MKSLGSGREKLRDPSSKPQASSNKLQAQATRATSHKQQASSIKRQASSTKRFQKPGARFITHKFRFKLQATSCKLPDTGTLIKFWHLEAGILNSSFWLDSHNKSVSFSCTQYFIFHHL
jgi:hypothetical protein